MSASPSTPTAAPGGPYRPSPQSQAASRFGPSSASSSSRFHPQHHRGPGAYTPAMRDRQARGKDPYRADNDAVPASRYGDDYDYDERDDDDEDDDEDSDDSMYGFSARRPSPRHRDRQRDRLRQQQEQQPFAQAERRRNAAAVLDSPELLMMYAQSRGDSIPATRLRFMKIMCGYDEEETPAPQAPARAAGGGGTGIGGGGGRTGGRQSTGPRRSDVGNGSTFHV